MALWHFSKVKSPTAQAIFSGVRTEDACNKITRIADAENWSEPRKTAWQAITTRVGIYRILRNEILHYGAEWQSENLWVVTNRDFVHKLDKITETPVTVEILADATADLGKLSIHLFNFVFEGEMNAPIQRDQVLKRAWRYTPPQPKGCRDTTRDSAPKHSRQPRPSRASRRQAALEKTKKN